LFIIIVYDTPGFLQNGDTGASVLDVYIKLDKVIWLLDIVLHSTTVVFMYTTELLSTDQNAFVAQAAGTASVGPKIQYP
jgi:hypothetical protein